ncbi:hypothetical protein CRG98_008418 [Punica granatum]|uniref:Uncharacterized protein n=1 Tax=Punica granatum TaxID=22663 RepID=A0A2I0KSG0_PUNGR|nr:hypothetical protein CRG98_008418 [Punica granatum]
MVMSKALSTIQLSISNKVLLEMSPGTSVGDHVDLFNQIVIDLTNAKACLEVKEKFDIVGYTRQTWAISSGVIVRTRMWTLVGVRIARFWIARLGSVHGECGWNAREALGQACAGRAGVHGRARGWCWRVTIHPRVAISPEMHYLT